MMNETRTVLANLDWLIHHLDMRLDYAAGVVFDRHGEPEFMLSDLTIVGLTPATGGVIPEPGDTVEITHPRSRYGIRPHLQLSPEDLAAQKRLAEHFLKHPWPVPSGELGPE